MLEVELDTLAGEARRVEAHALAAWRGQGAVLLLEAEPSSGAMLLERCEPGYPLASTDGAEAGDELAAALLQRLWISAPSIGFPSLEGLGRRALKTASELHATTAEVVDDELVQRALGLLRALLAEPQEQVLLHGDFHHDNILAAQREPWLAIDPLPMVGERSYDAVQYLLFRKGDLADPAASWGSAIETFCRYCALDPRRVLAWTVPRLVGDALSALKTGTSLEHLESCQQDLWSARLALELLDQC